MRITWRRSWATEPERYDIPWSALVALLQSNAALTYAPNPDPKLKPLDLPLISFGHFHGGFKREQLDPAGLSAIALDYDDTPVADFAHVLEKVKEQGPGFAHTTWKHGTQRGAAYGIETVRARIILPFEYAGLVALNLWPTVWEGVARELDAPGLDRTCKNPERCYFVPATNPASPWPCWTEVW